MKVQKAKNRFIVSCTSGHVKQDRRLRMRKGKHVYGFCHVLFLSEDLSHGFEIKFISEIKLVFSASYVSKTTKYIIYSHDVFAFIIITIYE